MCWLWTRGNVVVCLRMWLRKFPVRASHVYPTPLYVSVVLGLTVAALGRGLSAMLTADKHKSQRMMRYRVFFQLCTVGAVIGGVYYQAARQFVANNDAPDAHGTTAKVAVDGRLHDAGRFEPDAAHIAPTGTQPALQGSELR